MELLTTETYERTADVYYDKLTPVEYAVKLKAHVELGHPGKPSVYRYRQIVSMGGTRSSKSYSILQLLMTELIRKPGIKITVWRNTKVTCKSSVMEDFQKIIAFDNFIFKNFKENKQLSTFIYIPTGSKIVFTGADDVGKVLGGAQDISFFNEVTEFNKEVYLQITQRTADRVICDYNPSKDFWLEKYRFNDDTVFIHSTFEHNYYCPVNIVNQVLSYEPWESGSYEIKGMDIFYKGNPITKNNEPPIHRLNHKQGTANKYSWLVYGLGIGSEKPTRIYHNWRKITNKEFDEIEHNSNFGIDFGTSNPTACVEVKFDGDGTFYIKERLYKPMGLMKNPLPTELKSRIPELTTNNILVGDSAKQSFIDMLLEAGYLAIPAIKGSGSVETGISLCQSLTIFYVPSENLETEYINYSWNIDRYGKPTDVPVKKDDHLMDAIRYIITYIVKYYGVRL